MQAGRRITQEMYGSTMAYVGYGDLVLVASIPHLEPSDNEWNGYVQLLERTLSEQGRMRSLVFGGDKPPTARQRSHFSSRISGGDLRMAIVLGGKRLMPIVKIFTWFVSNTRAFGPDEVRQALGYLEVPPEPKVLHLIEGLRHARWASSG